jgi:hypothetical protein
LSFVDPLCYLYHLLEHEEEVTRICSWRTRKNPPKVPTDISRVGPGVPRSPASRRAVLEAEIVGADGAACLRKGMRCGCYATYGDKVARRSADIPVGDSGCGGGGEKK